MKPAGEAFVVPQTLARFASLFPVDYHFALSTLDTAPIHAAQSLFRSCLLETLSGKPVINTTWHDTEPRRETTMADRMSTPGQTFPSSYPPVSLPCKIQNLYLDEYSPDIAKVHNVCWLSKLWISYQVIMPTRTNM